MDVYVNDISMFLPNSAVNNDDIEEVLGKINGFPSRVKRLVLKNNGIKERYYAVNRETGELTHSNAQLSAEAVKLLKPHEDFDPEQIQCLCCGTTSPDLLFPGHALMVQGELGLPPVEAVTTSGICASGMTAFKYAFMCVATGMSQNAVAVGSELSSSYMRSDFFSAQPDPDVDIEKRPMMAFDTDFLRWMLSDGAGAAFLSPTPSPVKPSLRVDWIDFQAYAGEFNTCMYGGGIKNEDGSMTGWRQIKHSEAAGKKHLMAVKQDIRQLDINIVDTMKRTLAKSIEKHDLGAHNLDWFLPHYSSHHFRDKIYQGMVNIGFEVSYDRWFTNLETTGNTGAASIYIIMAELFHSGKLKKGGKITLLYP